MAYLTVEELRQHVRSSPLPDEALQRIIDDVTDEIDDRYGKAGENVSIRLVASSYQSFLTLPRRASAIVSITELLSDNLGGATTRLLDPADYALRDGFRIERIATGPTPASYWTSYGTDVVFTPKDDSQRRAMAIVDVAKLELAHSGFASRRLGDYSEAKGTGQGGQSLDVERAEILRKRLAPRGGVVFA